MKFPISPFLAFGVDGQGTETWMLSVNVGEQSITEAARPGQNHFWVLLSVLLSFGWCLALNHLPHTHTHTYACAHLQHHPTYLSQPKHYSIWLRASSHQEQPRRLFPALINTNHHALQCLQYLSFSISSLSFFLLSVFYWFFFIYLLNSSLYCFHSRRFTFLFSLLISLFFYSFLCNGFHVNSLLWIVTTNFLKKLLRKHTQPCPEKAESPCTILNQLQQ